MGTTNRFETQSKIFESKLLQGGNNTRCITWLGE